MAFVGVPQVTAAKTPGTIAAQSVPLRALTLSLVAMAGAVTASVYWPDALLDQEVLAGGLALIPALLLAHYRGWPVVTALLGVGFVVIRIEDSGPGIPKEHLEKIFDPFFTTQPTGRGTGLGLSVSQQIVDMHGGTIEVGNRESGGARVTVTLKVHREEEVAS